MYNISLNYFAKVLRRAGQEVLPAYSRKIAGRLLISGLFFFHPATDFVFIHSLSAVMSTAMQS